MKSLLERLNQEWKDCPDSQKKDYLEQLHAKYSATSYYELFNVSMTSIDTEVVRASFRKLALILHPDKSSGKMWESAAEELFKLVKNAYETLTDSAKEAAYQAGINAKTQPSASQSYFDPGFFGASFHSSSQPKHPNFSVFSGNVFRASRVVIDMTSRSETRQYDRDIKAGETITTLDENIIINGHVYGVVQSTSGYISITGHVYGKVVNISGNNTIGGNVTKDASVHNTSGNNKIKGNVLGKVVSISGNNKVDGDALGTVTTTLGGNQIKGKGSDQVKKLADDPRLFNRRARTGSQARIVIDGQPVVFHFQ